MLAPRALLTYIFLPIYLYCLKIQLLLNLGIFASMISLKRLNTLTYRLDLLAKKEHVYNVFHILHLQDMFSTQIISLYLEPIEIIENWISVEHPA